jgi:hypothetical protein
MKVIITESQFNDLFFKRRFAQINSLVEEKMVYYPPCDYTYDPYYAFHDYYGDVRNAVIYNFITENIRLDWEEGNMSKIGDLSETMNEWMYEIFYDKVRGYFDGVMEKGCEE